jgi:hypothetical protein
MTYGPDKSQQLPGEKHLKSEAETAREALLKKGVGMSGHRSMKELAEKMAAIEGPGETVRKRFAEIAQGWDQMLGRNNMIDRLPVLPKSATVELLEWNLAAAADKVCGDICEQARTFQAALNPDEEIGVTLVHLGANYTIRVDEFGYKNPCLLVFVGELDSGHKVRLIQHVQQVNCLLVALQRAPNRPVREMGFWVPTNEGGIEREATAGGDFE